MRCIFVSFATLFLLLSIPVIAQQASSAQAGISVDCRALETYSDSDLKVAAIVFHQAEESQRSPLAALLREHSGEIVEIQAAHGRWRRARMVRLKSCFGRGLLLLSAPAEIAEHAEFMLRFPPAAAR